MAFDTPQPPLSNYLEWIQTGQLQLPDFQRGWTWEDERVRSLLVTVLRGHPMGAVMLLETGNDLVRFKPKPIEGMELAQPVDPRYLLLDGQQRLTSLSQALTGDGVVRTKDSKGKLITRRYYVDVRKAVEGEEAIDDAVFATPEDGIIRENIGRDIKLDLSTRELELQNERFPLRLLFAPFDGPRWVLDLEDDELAKAFSDRLLGPVAKYQIPAIELKKDTSKSAVATVFEKVNTGGVPLTVFELLTATYAGDAEYFAKHGTDFRLNDDWKEIRQHFAQSPILRTIDSTDFLAGLTLLATRKRHLAHAHTHGDRAPAISAKRESILRLELNEYLEWREALFTAFDWVGTFIADQHIFSDRYLPYSTQLVPLAVLRVILGSKADTHGVKNRLRQWYWCGILGELYGSSTETRFARDVEQVPPWALGDTDATPLTITDANFAETRLYTLRTRRSAAYKGIYTLLISRGAKDWIRDVSFDKVQYMELDTDIHHIFPDRWCKDNKIDPVKRDSIVNKTPLAKATNRSIGGAAPSIYLPRVEAKSQQTPAQVDQLLTTHGILPTALRSDNFDEHFEHRKTFILTLIEEAMGKRVQREEGTVNTSELASSYEPEDEDELDDASEGAD